MTDEAPPTYDIPQPLTPAQLEALTELARLLLEVDVKEPIHGASDNEWPGDRGTDRE